MSKLMDGNTRRQIERMRDSLEDFTDAWNQIATAWQAMQRECGMSLEFTMTGTYQYQQLRQFFQQYGVQQTQSMTGPFREMALSLEKELRAN